MGQTCVGARIPSHTHAQYSRAEAEVGREPGRDVRVVVDGLAELLQDALLNGRVAADPLVVQTDHLLRYQL